MESKWLLHLIDSAFNECRSSMNIIRHSSLFGQASSSIPTSVRDLRLVGSLPRLPSILWVKLETGYSRGESANSHRVKGTDSLSKSCDLCLPERKNKNQNRNDSFDKISQFLATSGSEGKGITRSLSRKFKLKKLKIVSKETIRNKTIRLIESFANLPLKGACTLRPAGCCCIPAPS